MKAILQAGSKNKSNNAPQSSEAAQPPSNMVSKGTGDASPSKQFLRIRPAGGSSACEMIELLSQLPLPDNAENWDEDDFYNLVEQVAFGFDRYSAHRDSLVEAEDALEWLRGLFEEDPEQNEMEYTELFPEFMEWLVS